MSEFKEFAKIPRLNRDVVITEKIDGTNAQILIEVAETEDRGGTRAGAGKEPAGDEIAVVQAIDPDDATRGITYGVYAGSRSRWLKDDGKKGWDNYGFGAWVRDNAAALVRLFGPGRVFGEWWGAGVQRKYGLTGKRFSLFNVSRYGEQDRYVDERCVVSEKDYGGGSWTKTVEHKFHKGVKVCQCREARLAIDAIIGGVQIAPVPVLYRGPWITDYDHMVGGEQSGQWAPFACLGVLREHGSIAAPGFMDPEGIVIWHEASGQLFKATVKGDEKPKGVA